MVRLIILAALAGCALAAVMQQPAKVGEKVELTVGKGARTWERIVKGKKQTIKYCSPTEKNVACGSWINTKGKPVAKGASVSKDGKLTIAKVTLGDAGSYSSPDIKGKETKHEDGSVSMLAPPLILLIVKA
ncbi:hypothetical protein PRIPAC_71527 [Pristionchus pacificus]|uniref:Uncharacterized protein n=1 Tax=Pristionchus pacificus TaxID=54126 RepID=A0A2A6C787_PRIPA|nr:hypothetical protein PRIPAC_71527 [Pristionchus pacificus]|eukprot:PDM73928.1 hypothetical protein PRIPAC_41284 [Pristionchus pacificus]